MPSTRGERRLKARIHKEDSLHAALYSGHFSAEPATYKNRSTRLSGLPASSCDEPGYSPRASTEQSARDKESAGSEMKQQLIFWPFIPVQTK